MISPARCRPQNRRCQGSDASRDHILRDDRPWQNRSCSGGGSANPETRTARQDRRQNRVLDEYRSQRRRGAIDACDALLKLVASGVPCRITDDVLWRATQRARRTRGARTSYRRDAGRSTAAAGYPVPVLSKCRHNGYESARFAGFESKVLTPGMRPIDRDRMVRRNRTAPTAIASRAFRTISVATGPDACPWLSGTACPAVSQIFTTSCRSTTEMLRSGAWPDNLLVSCRSAQHSTGSAFSACPNPRRLSKQKSY